MDGIDALREAKGGRIVTRESDLLADVRMEYRFRDGVLQSRKVYRSRHMFPSPWVESCETVNYFLNTDGWEANDSGPEYDLTFIEALRAMLCGESVSPEVSPYLTYSISDGRILCSNKSGMSIPATVNPDEQYGRWMIVRR